VSAIQKDQGAAHFKPHEHPSTPFPSSRVAYYTLTSLMLAAIVSLLDRQNAFLADHPDQVELQLI